MAKVIIEQTIKFIIKYKTKEPKSTLVNYDMLFHNYLVQIMYIL